MAVYTLEDYVGFINEKTTDIYSLVANVEAVFENLQRSIMLQGMAKLDFTPLTPAAVLLLEWKQEQAVDIVDTCVNGKEGSNNPSLKQFIECMDFPVTLIETANQWRNVKTFVTNAGNACSDAELEVSKWEGDGQEAYEYMRRFRQAPAFKATVDFTEKMAEVLEDFADGVLSYYNDLHTNIISLINTVKNFLGSVMSIKLVQAFVDLLSETCGTITDLIWSIVKSLAKARIAGNTILDSVGANLGYTMENKWPTPDVSSFSDFSTWDKSDSAWEVR
ncbi:hypothetical protein HLB23_39495 [Nocardia uniformis]|uniref:Uncharacterized protein n=1 Tax=Nocardia uniformis TaxID=53432 RepID=A0A849CAK6_9NOCA|nr:hypothetical protein [Nocardia uniformis]NNH75873.1 hypothetical protein [Nocardia uniformis]